MEVYIYAFKVTFSLGEREYTEVISGKIQIYALDENDVEANATKKCLDSFEKRIKIHDITKVYLGRDINFTDPDAETCDD